MMQGTKPQLLSELYQKNLNEFDLYEVGMLIDKTDVALSQCVGDGMRMYLMEMYRRITRYYNRKVGRKAFMTTPSCLLRRPVAEE